MHSKPLQAPVFICAGVGSGGSSNVITFPFRPGLALKGDFDLKRPLGARKGQRNATCFNPNCCSLGFFFNPDDEVGFKL